MTEASKRQQGWRLSIQDSAFRAGCPVTCILFLPVCRCRLEKSARKRGKAKASNLNANRWPNSTKSQRHGMGRAGGAPLRARHCTSKMKLIPKWLLQNNPDKQLILSFIPKSSRLPGVWVLGTTMSTIKIPLWKCVFHWVSDVVLHDWSKQTPTRLKSFNSRFSVQSRLPSHLHTFLARVPLQVREISSKERQSQS